MNRRFVDSGVLVTGAGKAFGREIAQLFAREGAKVIAISRTQADLDSLRKQIDCIAISANLASAEEAQHAAELAGEVDLLVNNAGISCPAFLETTAEAFDRTLAVNVAGIDHLQVVARAWLSRRHPEQSSMCRAGSMAALDRHAAYCASRARSHADQSDGARTRPAWHSRQCRQSHGHLTPMGEWRGATRQSAPMLAKIPLGRSRGPVKSRRRSLFCWVLRPR